METSQLKNMPENMPKNMSVKEVYILYLLFNIYVTVNVIKLVIMHISRLLCIISSPVGKSDEKPNFITSTTSKYV